MSRFTWDRRTIMLAGASWFLGACSSRFGSRPGPTSPPPGAPVSPPPTTAGLIYTVQKGDTLSSISRRSGLAVKDIIVANRLSSSNIKIGQRLKLPDVHALHVDPLSQVVTAKVEQPGQDATPVRPGAYVLVRRHQWTNDPVRPNNRKMGQVHRITVHHTSEHGRMSRMTDLDVVKSIERYHRNERKWAAIGYHYLVGRDGKVYEGRPASIQGAHTRSNNRNNLGISMIGDFQSHTPSAKQLATLESLLEDMRRRYGVPKRLVFGHRDLSPSACPGKHLYAWLQGYKRR